MFCGEERKESHFTYLVTIFTYLVRSDNQPSDSASDQDGCVPGRPVVQVPKRGPSRARGESLH